MAVNPNTNQIYVATMTQGSNSGNVTVIDGTTNNTTTVAVGTYPYAIAVNPLTNQIYVANQQQQQRDGDRRGHQQHDHRRRWNHPDAVAVNPVTNQIYVANVSSNNVTVIDGATTTRRPWPWENPHRRGSEPEDQPDLRRQLWQRNNVTVIDGATNNTTTVAAGTDPHAVAVNPVTNKIYVANN